MRRRHQLVAAEPAHREPQPLLLPPRRARAGHRQHLCAHARHAAALPDPDAAVARRRGEFAWPRARLGRGGGGDGRKLHALYVGGVAVEAGEQLAREHVDEGERAALVAHHALRRLRRRQRHAGRRLPDGRTLRRLLRRVLPQHKLAWGTVRSEQRSV